MSLDKCDEARGRTQFPVGVNSAPRRRAGRGSDAQAQSEESARAHSPSIVCDVISVKWSGWTSLGDGIQSKASPFGLLVWQLSPAAD